MTLSCGWCMSRPFWDFGRLATDGVAGIVAVMCDYCDCRAQPEIAALSAQHEEILAVVGALRRLLDDGCDVGEAHASWLSCLCSCCPTRAARRRECLRSFVSPWVLITSNGSIVSTT